MKPSMIFNLVGALLKLFLVIFLAITGYSAYRVFSVEFVRPGTPEYYLNHVTQEIRINIPFTLKNNGILPIENLNFSLELLDVNKTSLIKNYTFIKRINPNEEKNISLILEGKLTRVPTYGRFNFYTEYLRHLKLNVEYTRVLEG